MILANYIGNDSKRFEELMQYFFSSENRTSQRAAHAMSHCVDLHPTLLLPYLTKIIDTLKGNPKVAIKRNIVRLLQKQSIPASHQGILTSTCFDYLMDSKETVAVKAFSMTILFNMTRSYPDLTHELKLVIEDAMINGSAGIISRGKKILMQLD